MKTATQARCLAAGLAIALGAIVASAQTADKRATEMKDASHSPMAHDDAANMPSMHTMPATVTAVDAKTGVVDVTSEGMPVKVHFPANTVANLKTGDRITLHLGFTKG